MEIYHKNFSNVAPLKKQRRHDPHQLQQEMSCLLHAPISNRGIQHQAYFGNPMHPTIVHAYNSQFWSLAQQQQQQQEQKASQQHEQILQNVLHTQGITSQKQYQQQRTAEFQQTCGNATMSGKEHGLKRRAVVQSQNSTPSPKLLRASSEASDASTKCAEKTPSHSKKVKELSPGENTTEEIIAKKCAKKKRRRVPWTPLQHKMFLEGLARYGKGKWKKIQEHVNLCSNPKKTIEQVRSHNYMHERALRSKSNDSGVHVSTPPPHDQSDTGLHDQLGPLQLRDDEDVLPALVLSRADEEVAFIMSCMANQRCKNGEQIQSSLQEACTTEMASSSEVESTTFHAPSDTDSVHSDESWR